LLSDAPSSKRNHGDRSTLCDQNLFIEPDPQLRADGANPFDYLTELQRHAEELKHRPSEWMPWNYCETVGRLARPADA
jgi:hypothetical protein